jgi:methylmalonyl-CoA/ethylmalonyl-CoA epimerase
MSSDFSLTSVMQIAIRVRDVGRATATYRDRFGLKHLFDAPPSLAFFDCGGMRLMLSPSEPGEFDHPASLLYFRVDDIHAAHAELAARGVSFRSAPHQIADLGDRVVWLSDFEDGEDNVFALMSEVPKHT